jgi:hypothetical protein
MVVEKQEPGDGAGMMIFAQTSSRVNMLKQPEHMAKIRRPECISLDAGVSATLRGGGEA